MCQISILILIGDRLKHAADSQLLWFLEILEMLGLVSRVAKTPVVLNQLKMV